MVAAMPKGCIYTLYHFFPTLVFLSQMKHTMTLLLWQITCQNIENLLHLEAVMHRTWWPDPYILISKDNAPYRGQSQRACKVKGTSYQCRRNVKMLRRRCYDCINAICPLGLQRILRIRLITDRNVSQSCTKREKLPLHKTTPSKLFYRNRQ